MPNKVSPNYLGKDENGLKRYTALECGHIVSDAKKNFCKSCSYKQRRKQFCKNGHDTIAFGRGKTGECRECKQIRALNTPRAKLRNSYLKCLYGITLEDFDRMFEEQGGVCYICKQPQEKVLCVDHDHSMTENSVRHLLCNSCNIFVGMVETNGLARFRQALEYLSE